MNANEKSELYSAQCIADRKPQQNRKKKCLHWYCRVCKCTIAAARRRRRTCRIFHREGRCGKAPRECVSNCGGRRPFLAASAKGNPLGGRNVPSFSSFCWSLINCTRTATCKTLNTFLTIAGWKMGLENSMIGEFIIWKDSGFISWVLVSSRGRRWSCRKHRDLSTGCNKNKAPGPTCRFRAPCVRRRVW